MGVVRHNFYIDVRFTLLAFGENGFRALACLRFKCLDLQRFEISLFFAFFDQKWLWVVTSFSNGRGYYYYLLFNNIFLILVSCVHFFLFFFLFYIYFESFESFESFQLNIELETLCQLRSLHNNLLSRKGVGYNMAAWNLREMNKNLPSSKKMDLKLFK